MRYAIDTATGSPRIQKDFSHDVRSHVRSAIACASSRLLVALTPGLGLARLGPGARSVALNAAAHADSSGSRVALTWHARAGHR